MPHRARLPGGLAPPSLHHYSDDGVLRLDLDGGDESTDHSHEVEEGVVLHFLRSEDRPDRLASVEIMHGLERDLSALEIVQE